MPETLFPLSVLLTIVMRPAPSLEIPSPTDLPWRFGRDFAANFLMSQLLLFSAERRVPAYRAAGSERPKAARICC